MTRLGITGHQSVPEAAWTYVNDKLQARLATERDLTGVSSLAAGADQAFARLVLAQGGRLEVVIPSQGYESSFQTVGERREFDRALSSAENIEVLGFREPSEDAYLAAGKRVVDRSEVLIAVWDGKPAQGRGGTADIVEYARQIGTPVEVIWPAGTAR